MATGVEFGDPKHCSVCGAQVTLTGEGSASIVNGKDEDGFNLSAHPDPTGIGAIECWKQGICPCCGTKTLGLKNEGSGA